MSKEKRYYIAYGSNLNVAQMVRRCPGAKPIGTAELEHNTLYFRGSGSGYYLTIEPKIGSRVPVAVWEVTAEDEKALDRYEGYPRFYYKHDFDLAVTLLDSRTTKELRCFAYIMTDGRDVGLPTPYYMETCIQGYRDFGFDTRILKRTVERMRKILWKRKNLK
ncbi:gamma-glutamylcyclotransferase family protein [Candidatus Pseudoruminococcus sp.]|uniref:gamma-glutamylcyclotransferase family protein n=1 Tax=Candidatus Pseudoruminococcus sp. TaxID=3101048 RepID=UPI0039998A25